MKYWQKVCAMICAPIVLIACGGDSSSSSSSGSASVSFSVSDAPVDSADEVVIAFDQIELVDGEGESTLIDVSSGDGTLDYIQVDLLEYQGENSLMIVSDQAVPIGSYDNLILHISSESGLTMLLIIMASKHLNNPAISSA